jgi:DNA-binding transcriptional MerR regulator/methylmalonyl-CoA mutase cobalamin-binding subunit
MGTGVPGSADETEPLLSIGAVVADLVRTYPDVTHSSLRFLEREGLIAAVRTPGGHRLYTAGDMQRIRQIKAWQAQRLSLEDIRQRLAALDRLPPPVELADAFLRQALAGDLTGAYATIIAADDVGMPLSRVLQEVLRPALVAVGEQWACGVLRVGQEHEITEVARELIAELGLRHADPHPAGGAILAASVAGERHDLGLRMIVALLRAAGRRVHFLGADVDAQFLREEVMARRPPFVLLSATTAARLPALETAVGVLSQSGAATVAKVFVGGQIVREHADSLRQRGVVPVDDDDLETALQTILATVNGAEAP